METNNKFYDADLYLRLSREDGDKAESDSIANQRDLLLSLKPGNTSSGFFHLWGYGLFL